MRGKEACGPVEVKRVASAGVRGIVGVGVRLSIVDLSIVGNIEDRLGGDGDWDGDGVGDGLSIRSGGAPRNLRLAGMN